MPVILDQYIIIKYEKEPFKSESALLSELHGNYYCYPGNIDIFMKRIKYQCGRLIFVVTMYLSQIK